MSVQLKLENHIKRDPDRKAREIPDKPLTALESAYLSVVSFNACLRSYKVRMVSSALLGDYEEDGDLNGESFIFMWNILGKFDTAAYQDKETGESKITGFVYIVNEDLEKKLLLKKTEIKKEIFAIQRKHAYTSNILILLKGSPADKKKGEKLLEKMRVETNPWSKKLEAIEEKIKANHIELSLDEWVKKGAEIHLEDGTVMTSKQLLAKEGDINWVALEYWRTKKPAAQKEFRIVLEDGKEVIAKEFLLSVTTPAQVRELAKRDLKVLMYEENKGDFYVEAEFRTTALTFKEGDINLNSVQVLANRGAGMSYMKKKAKDSEKIIKIVYKNQLLQTFDVTGPKAPKTLKFFFVNYFYGRVNFVACEARNHKKQRGVGPAESVAEVTYDPEDNSNLSIMNHQYDITGKIFAEVSKKSLEFKRFFYQQYTLEVSARELREEYGEKFNSLSLEMKKFLTELKKQHKTLIP